MSAAERKHFYLYVDEFHHFVTPSMAAILSGARKYHLGLVLAHQELNQLWSRDKEVASAVISNPYTRVCFRLGDFDAKKLEDGFSHFNAKDLQNLGVGEAICRMERSEYDFNLKTSPLATPDRAVARSAGKPLWLPRVSETQCDGRKLRHCCAETRRLCRSRSQCESENRQPKPRPLPRRRNLQFQL